jgi:DNA-directed RNA polymerase subunit H (RpoH/RPB5)
MYLYFVPPLRMEDLGGTLVSLIYKAKTTQLEMLDDRQWGGGMDSKGEPFKDYMENVDIFYDHYSTLMDDYNNLISIMEVMTEVAEIDKDNYAYIYWTPLCRGKTERTSKSCIDEMVVKARGLELSRTGQKMHIILIIYETLGSEAAKRLDEYIGGDYQKLEVFTYRDLLLNPIKWHRVPKHVRLTAEQKREYIVRLAHKNTRPDQLPKLFDTDRVSRHYGFRDGDIIRIYRNAYTNVGNKKGQYIIHRLVTRNVTY